MKIKTLNIVLTKNDEVTIYAFTQDDKAGADAVMTLLANEHGFENEEFSGGIQLGILMNDDASIIIERIMSK